MDKVREPTQDEPTDDLAIPVRKADDPIPTETTLAENANVIRTLGRRTVEGVIEIGRRLTESKKLCGHGNWLPWLEREFGWGKDQTARNFMKVYEMSLNSQRRRW
jgi:hypothetical protein